MSNPIYRSAYNAAQIEAAIDKGPRVNASGYWEVWNVETMAYVSTGVGAGVKPPTVVTQVSQMTNHGYVYIYNGSETGYTAGYWYYWNGSAWTAGGAYQSAPVDPTLSVAGAAADAKACGDIKSAVGDLMVVPYAVSIGSLVASGSLNPTTGYNGTNSSKYTRTGYISVSRFALMVMDSNEYEFTAWSYTGNTVSTKVRSLTNQEYTTKNTFIFPPGGSNNIRIGFHRLDDAVLTTDTSDPTSDFSKIAAAVKFFRFTDTSLSIPDAAADAKMAGRYMAVARDSVSGGFGAITGDHTAVFRPGLYRTATTSPAIGDAVYYAESSTGNGVCAILPCKEGDNIFINIYSYGGYTRGWYFVDADMKVISLQDSVATQSKTFLTAPVNTSYILLTNDTQNLPDAYYAYVDKSLLYRTSGVSNQPYDFVKYAKRSDLEHSTAYFFKTMMPAGKYALYIKASSTYTGHDLTVKLLNTLPYGTDNVVYSTTIKNGIADCVYITVEEPFVALYIFPADTVTESQDYSVTIVSAPELYKGPYVKKNTAHDMSRVIEGILAIEKHCELDAGDYFVSNIVMADASRLNGQGNSTRLYMIDSAVGPAISMKSECRVDNLALYGSEDATYDEASNTTKFLGSEDKDFSGETNLWEDGDQSVPDTGYKHLVLTNPLPPGGYYLGVDSLTSDATPTTATMNFSTSKTISITPGSIIADVVVAKGTNKGAYFYLSETAYSVRVRSANYTDDSAGHTAAWDGISIVPVASRCGIGWVQDADETLKAGSVTACRIERFDCAGIYGMDTGTPVTRGLSISNCQILYCSVGIYFRKNTEFHQATASMICRCYYGILNRGGNNIFSACAISGNYINAQEDLDEGNNTGHGMITSCKLHHSGYSANDQYAVVIRDTGRIVVSGCEISDKIMLKNTDGNVVSDCAMFDVQIEVEGGQCSLISNSIFRSATAMRTNNSAAVLANCYLRNGTPVTWAE